MIMINPDQPANLPPSVDLRRRPNLNVAHWLVFVAAHLDDEDRALIEAVFRDGITLRTIARLRGVSRYAIGRRIRQLTARLTDPRFIQAVNCLPEWPRRRADLARLCILRGHTVREAAELLGITEHVARSEFAIVNTLIREAIEAEMPSMSLEGGAA